MEEAEAVPQIEDQPIYDAFAGYYDPSDIDRAAEIAFYLSLIREGDRALLELACGTGIITTRLADRILARHGAAARIAGLDVSEEMLKIARARDPRVEWIVGDMRAPSVAGGFDIVICAFNTLQQILSDAELVETFRAVRNLLNPGGFFVFDIFRPDFESLNAWPAEQRLRSFSDNEGHLVELWESGRYDPSARILFEDWRVVDPRAAAALPLALLPLKLRQFLPNEIEQFLAAANLEIRERFGDVHKSPFTATSKKQVVICVPGRGSAAV